MAHLVFPSILSADFSSLRDVCEMINNSDADGFHLDVMDGLFVPNISFGFPIIKAIYKHARKPLDVHLMIVEPELYLERFKDAGASTLTVHFEACADIRCVIDTIKKLEISACIAIKPQTPVAILTDIIADIDAVCLMSVKPGFGGQAFIGHTFNKIESLKEIIRDNRSNALIKIDGGVDLNNYSRLVETGADILVAGTSAFGAEDPVEAIASLKKI
jgi:ribulose-phosphate 3-epimerase